MARQPNFTPCLEYDCNKYAVEHGRCKEHYIPWSGVTRNKNLPRDWKVRREQVLRRDKYRCYACGGVATEVDHVRNGNDHTMRNLKAICRPHHEEKSSWEGHTAQGHNVRMPQWLVSFLE